MLRRRSTYALLPWLLFACGGDPGAKPGGDAGGGGGDGGPIGKTRPCATTFSLRADPGTAAALAGEWDWSARTPLEDPNGDGVLTAEIDLPPGLYAYKFVLAPPGGGEEWILDPGNPYRKYSGGIENSAVRVEDCGDPLLVLDSHEVTASGALTRAHLLLGSTGAPVAAGDLAAVLRHDFSETPVEVAYDGRSIEVALDGLAPGKYTLVLSATDRDGRAARPLRLPFWIEKERFDWEGALIYMVMVDRFRNGEPQNDPGPSLGAEPAADFHGGDLAGVTAALEDGTFDRLGVRALWLSPVVRNTDRVHYDGDHGITAYHGYWPVRAREVDPRIGGEAALEELVAAAHRRGIRVLMDFVINHVHEDHEYVAAHPDWFRTGCQCGTPGCDWTERRLDCVFRPYLPDVNWQSSEAGEQIIADALWWLERFDLDGLRVDAVKHVEDVAIFNLATRIHRELEQGGTDYFLLGETAMGWAGHDRAANQPEYDTISRYVGEHALSGQFDFVLYHATAYRVWADDQYGMIHLDYWTRASLEEYPPEAIMTPFVGSHDSERLISLATYGSGSPLVHHKWQSEGLPAPPSDQEPYDRAALALTWLMTVPGAPLLYYGDEYGEHGGADPDNRHMWRPPEARSAAQAALEERVARAGRARRELEPLRRGAYTPLTVTEEFLSFARHTESEAVVVAINRSPATVTEVIAIPAGLPVPALLVDRLAPGSPPLERDGDTFTVTLGPRSAAIFAAP